MSIKLSLISSNEIFLALYDLEVPKGTSKNVVSTSHNESADVSMSSVVSANKNSFYINTLIHSHPGGGDASQEDLDMKSDLYNLNQERSPENGIYIPNKINRHSPPVNNRFGTDKYNKKMINGKYLGY